MGILFSLFAEIEIRNIGYLTLQTGEWRGVMLNKSGRVMHVEAEFVGAAQVAIQDLST